MSISSKSIKKLIFIRFKVKPTTAHFTSLTLNTFYAGRRTLANIVAWPAKLEHFEFIVDDLVGCTDFCHVESALAPQRDTLKTLRLMGVSLPSRVAAFDLSNFPYLEELTLCQSDTVGHTWGLEKIQPPRLRFLCWDFRRPPVHRLTRHATTRDCIHKTLTDVGPREEEWLRALAAAADLHKTALQRIHIRYSPWVPANLAEVCPCCSLTPEERADFTYPWDRLDRVARDIQSQGIELTYDPPICTMDEIRNLFTTMDTWLDQT